MDLWASVTLFGNFVGLMLVFSFREAMRDVLKVTTRQAIAKGVKKYTFRLIWFLAGLIFFIFGFKDLAFLLVGILLTINWYFLSKKSEIKKLNLLIAAIICFIIAIGLNLFIKFFYKW